MPKTAPAFDLLGAVFNALAVGAPGGLPLALGGVVAAALVVQVLRGEVEKHIPTVDVIIERVLTYHGVIDFPVVSDFRKGGSGGKALDHDQLLQPPGQGVVLANLEVPALSLRKSLYFRSATSGQ